MWRKTLRGGMRVVIPTTTESTTAKRRRKSRNRNINPRTVSVYRLVAKEFLRGWQYNNLLLACTAALSRTALDALENRCTYLRVCQVVQRYVNSVSRAKYYGILGRGAVVEVYCCREQDRRRSRATGVSYGKATNSLAVFCGHCSWIPVLPAWLSMSYTASGQG